MLADFFNKENIIIILLLIGFVQSYWVYNQQSKAIEPAVRYSVSNSEEIQKLKDEIDTLKKMVKTLSEKENQ